MSYEIGIDRTDHYTEDTETTEVLRYLLDAYDQYPGGYDKKVVEKAIDAAMERMSTEYDATTSVWDICGRQFNIIAETIKETRYSGCSTPIEINMDKVLNAIKRLRKTRPGIRIREQLDYLIGVLAKEYELHPESTFTFYESY